MSYGDKERTRVYIHTFSPLYSNKSQFEKGPPPLPMDPNDSLRILPFLVHSLLVPSRPLFLGVENLSNYDMVDIPDGECSYHHLLDRLWYGIRSRGSWYPRIDGRFPTPLRSDLPSSRSFYLPLTRPNPSLTPFYGPSIHIIW